MSEQLLSPMLRLRASPGSSANEPAWGVVVRYGVACVVVATATLVAFFDLDFSRRTPFLLFYPVPVLALLFGGLGPGLIAAVLSGLAVDYVLLPPYYTAAIHHPDMIRVGIFVAIQVTLCLLLDSRDKALRRSEARHRSMNADLERRVGERTAQLQTINEELLTEVAERKRAEEAVRRANAYNRSLIEASLDPLVTIGPDGKITDVNAATEAVTGRARAELIGTDFSDYFAEPEKARAGYRQVFREGFVRDYPLELRHRDGHITSVVYNASTYRDEAGNVIGVFAAARDVTERKRAEEAMRRYAEDLKRSNQELERFAYVASHDLQEPLRAVSSFSQLLARRYQGRLDASADEFIAFIVGGATRMQALINDLLAFSRVGTRGHAFAPVDYEDILQAATHNLNGAILETGAIITHDPLPVVSADRAQSTQLLQNLFSNAIKFRRQEEALRIHVSAVRQDGAWQFSVRDNGIGIAPQFFDRIFVIFQRLHGREEYPGTGIGLAICKKIVERHGGHIWVESELRRGSTFHFTIPDGRSDDEDGTTIPLN